MPAYLVTPGNQSGVTLHEGANACVVFAADATAAKEVCQARFPGASGIWSTGATVTEIVADADFNGWTFEVELDSGTTPSKVSFVGDATDNLIDEIGAKLVTALNATSNIAGASYNSTSNTLTVAQTTDNLGDKSVYVNIIPPGGDSSIASLVGTITHEGAVGAALTVVLPGDAAVIPIVAGVFKQ